MKVRLISMTPNPMEVMYVGARTCYSGSSPIDMYNDVNNRLDPPESCKKLVHQVLESGHLSIAEHVNFTFAIEGISRACSHQLVRHRHCTFSQQSQRYVEIKESQEELYDAYTENYGSGNFADTRIAKILNKYFIDGDKSKNVNAFYYALDNYLEAIKHGDKAEDARRFLPNATKTNIVMTCNLRQLMHIADLRLCTRAQTEIRMLFHAIKDEVYNYNDDIGIMLIPKCERQGFCDEHKSCGRMESKGVSGELS